MGLFGDIFKTVSRSVKNPTRSYRNVNRFMTKYKPVTRTN